MDVPSSETFDTLERLSKQRPDLGLSGHFARGTGGVDVDAVVRALVVAVNAPALAKAVPNITEGFTPHYGQVMPEGIGWRRVNIQFRDGTIEQSGLARNYTWSWSGGGGDIVGYQLVKAL